MGSLYWWTCVLIGYMPNQKEEYTPAKSNSMPMSDTRFVTCHHYRRYLGLSQGTGSTAPLKRKKQVTGRSPIGCWNHGIGFSGYYTV